jgi:hypothetical protein
VSEISIYELGVVAGKSEGKLHITGGMVVEVGGFYDLIVLGKINPESWSVAQGNPSSVKAAFQVTCMTSQAEAGGVMIPAPTWWNR